MRGFFNKLAMKKPVITDTRTQSYENQEKRNDDESFSLDAMTQQDTGDVKQKIFFKSLRSTCREDYARLKNDKFNTLMQQLISLEANATLDISARSQRQLDIIKDLAKAIYETSKETESSKCVGLVEQHFETIRRKKNTSPYTLFDAIPLVLSRLRNAASRSITYTGYITDLMNAIPLFEQNVNALNNAKNKYQADTHVILPRDFYISQERGMRSQQATFIPSCADNLDSRIAEMKYAYQQLQTLKSFFTNVERGKYESARKLFNFFEEIFDTIVFYADVKKKLFCVNKIIRDIKQFAKDYEHILPKEYFETYFLTDTMRDTVGSIMQDAESDTNDTENESLTKEEKVQRNKYLLKVLDMYFVQLNIFYCHIPELLAEMLRNTIGGTDSQYRPATNMNLFETEYPLFERDSVMCKQFYESIPGLKFPPRFVLTHYLRSIANTEDINELNTIIAKMPILPDVGSTEASFDIFLTKTMEQKRLKTVDETLFKYYKLVYSYRNYEILLAKDSEYEGYYNELTKTTQLPINIPKQYNPLPIMSETSSDTDTVIQNTVANDISSMQKYLEKLWSEQQIKPLVTHEIDGMFEKIKNTLPTNTGIRMPDDVQNPIQFKEYLVDVITRNLCEIIQNYDAFTSTSQQTSSSVIYQHKNPCTVYECVVAFLQDLPLLADVLIAQIDAVFGDMAAFYKNAQTQVDNMLQQQNKDIQNVAKQNELYLHPQSSELQMEISQQDDVYGEHHEQELWANNGVEVAERIDNDKYPGKGGKKTKGKHKKPTIRHRKQRDARGGAVGSVEFIEQQQELQQSNTMTILQSFMQSEVVLRCQTLISCVFKVLFGSIPYESDGEHVQSTAQQQFQQHFKHMFYSHVEKYYASNVDTSLLNIQKAYNIIIEVPGDVQLDICKAYLRFRPQIHIMMITAPKVASLIRDVIAEFDKQVAEKLENSTSKLSDDNHIRLLFDFTSDKVIQSVEHDVVSIFDVPKNAMLCNRVSSSDTNQNAAYVNAASKLAIDHKELTCTNNNLEE